MKESMGEMEKPKAKAKADAKAKPEAKTRKANPWIAHVKAWASKHKMSYRDAMKDPSMRDAYKK
jgi:hypothetical protein